MVARQVRGHRAGLLAAAATPAALTAAAVAAALPQAAEPDRGPRTAVEALARATPALRASPALIGPPPRLVPSGELGGGPRPAPPARLEIPGAGVRAAVTEVAADRRGIRVPPVGVAGWYRGGPRPGEAGRAVVIGHLDGARGPGVFARLDRVRQGAAVAVTTRRGERMTFRVAHVRRVPKTRFPGRSVYGPARRPLLVLVTCGGPWDERERSYRDNVIVYARAA